MLASRLNTLRLQRSLIAGHPLGGGWGLRRETGAEPNGRCRDSQFTAWAYGLNDRSLTSDGVEKFIYDSRVECVFASSSAIPTSYRARLGADLEGRDSTLPEWWWLPTAIVSFSLSPSRALMVTAMGNDSPSVDGIHCAASITLTKYLQPHEISRSEDLEESMLSRANAMITPMDLRSQFAMSSTAFWVSRF